ncbi:MAG: FAD-dependent oxidoreductase [Candidatus Levybacteria bacterium]|nr:FAD-dependent oxidoreductase [Candidatus Levybacteria bacterium]
MENKTLYDVIIIGSGPSGLTAGIYASRGNRKTLILAGRKWGGQLMLTTEVENFPGFPEPIMGPELMKRMRDQAVRYGAEILDVNFTGANYTSKPFEVSTDDDKKYYSKSIIVSTGADTKWLQIPGEQEKIGRGVSSCAPCDAAFYRNKRVVVIGGGDSAMEEALVLTKFAQEVYVIHRREEFKASDVMQKKVFENEKIKVIWNTEPLEVLGEMKVEALRLKSKIKDQNAKIKVKVQNDEKDLSVEELGGSIVSNENNEIVWEFPADGIFVAIGHIPNSQIFEGIEKDEKGFIKQYPGSKTNIEGVFVSGDVHDSTYMQGVTAAGYGCQAAIDAEKYLEMGE